MILRVEEACFPRKAASSQFQSRSKLFQKRTALTPEDSVLHLHEIGLQQSFKLLKAMLPPCCRPQIRSHMPECGRLPISDKQAPNLTLRRSAILQDNLRPAANQAGTTVPMDCTLAKISMTCPSHVPKPGQSPELQTRSQLLESLSMAAPRAGR